jgi:hypothetical protein
MRPARGSGIERRQEGGASPVSAAYVGRPSQAKSIAIGPDGAGGRRQDGHAFASARGEVLARQSLAPEPHCPQVASTWNGTFRGYERAMYDSEQPRSPASGTIVRVVNEVRTMKTRIAMTCLIAGTLLSPVAVIAQDSDTHRLDPEMFVKDSAITTQAKAKLATEHFSSLAKIHVDTDKSGIVRLSGTVESQAVIDGAMAITKRTEHVKSVHSTLTFKKDD